VRIEKEKADAEKQRLDNEKAEVEKQRIQKEENERIKLEEKAKI
jgi:hypothetical protein